MAICMWKVYERERRTKAYEEYVADTSFPALVEMALKKGFRHASLGEINASADSRSGALDLYSWKGGLWVKIYLENCAMTEQATEDRGDK